MTSKVLKLGCANDIATSPPVIYTELVDFYLSRYGHSLTDVFSLFGKLNGAYFAYMGYCEEDGTIPHIIESKYDVLRKRDAK